MPYTLGMTIIDLGSLYAGGFPSFSGRLTGPGGGAQSASSSPTSLVLNFSGSNNPPTPLSTLLITDPTGPGDFFRSGPLPAWTPMPAQIFAGTATVPMPWASLAVPTPIPILLPAGVVIGGGLATGLSFWPFRIDITRLTIGPSPIPGQVRGSFAGTLGYTTFFIPRRSAIFGTFDFTLSPSGDATRPGAIVKADATALAMTISFVTPLSTPLLNAIAPLFAGALSGPVSAAINASLGSTISAMTSTLSLTPGGPPVFSPAATVSFRRITVLGSGVVVQAVLAEVIAAPVTNPAPPPPVQPPAAQDELVAKITPAPEEGVLKHYNVRVGRSSDNAPVPNAKCVITTFNAVGTAQQVSAVTDSNGQAGIDVLLRSRFRPNRDPFHTGGLDRVSPNLTVSAAGFQQVVIDLFPDP